MKKELIKLANHLDQIGLIKEADYLDDIIKKLSSRPNFSGPAQFLLRERWDEPLAKKKDLNPVQQVMKKLRDAGYYVGLDDIKEISRMLDRPGATPDEVADSYIKQLERSMDPDYWDF